MTKRSNLMVSQKELRMMREQQFFRSKKRITEKIFHLLGHAALRVKQLRTFREATFPHGTDVSGGKISKGENYLGFPYIVLDFPRCFTKEHTLLLRTIFWWGNEISCVFIYSGKNLEQVRDRFLYQYASLKKKQLSLCVHDTAWHHHRGADNYRPLEILSKNEAAGILVRRDFLKVAGFLPVTEANEIPSFCTEHFNAFAKLLIQQWDYPYIEQEFER